MAAPSRAAVGGRGRRRAVRVGDVRDAWWGLDVRALLAARHRHPSQAAGWNDVTQTAPIESGAGCEASASGVGAAVAEGPGMTTKSLAAALGIAFACVLSASCMQATREAEATASPDPSSDQTSEPIGHEHVAEPEQTERTGEAQDPYTRADCQKAFVENIHKCYSWPVLDRPTCYVMCAGLLAACIKDAE